MYPLLFSRSISCLSGQTAISDSAYEFIASVNKQSILALKTYYNICEKNKDFVSNPLTNKVYILEKSPTRDRIRAVLSQELRNVSSRSDSHSLLPSILSNTLSYVTDREPPLITWVAFVAVYRLRLWVCHSLYSTTTAD